jgi:diaminopimelate decarboxylase
VHVGSQLLSVKPYVAALKKVVRFVKLHREALGLSPLQTRNSEVGTRNHELRTLNCAVRTRDGAGRGIAIEWINVGGGFGVFYREREALSAQEFADAVLPLAAKIAPRIVLEPGRFIVGNAGILLTRVLYTKDSGDKVFVVCDSGMNDLIRPSLYSAFHRIWPVRPRAASGASDVVGRSGSRPLRERLRNMGRTEDPHPNPLPEGEGIAESSSSCRPSGRRECLSAECSESQITADIVGPICESGDFLAKGIRLPHVSRGDLLSVFSTGAYGYSMASNYNSRPRSAEVLVSGRKHRLVSRRETYDDLVRRERP